MKLYISGPMTGLPGHNFHAFNRATTVLKEYGYGVENPAEKGLIDGWEWSDYLRYDLAKLVECDGVALLLDWRMSRGAQLEVHVARELGMETRTVTGWLAKAFQGAAEDGWRPFGTHAGNPGIKLEFKGTDEAGLPVWERPKAA